VYNMDTDLLKELGVTLLVYTVLMVVITKVMKGF
jgi:hypothetical protein